MLKREEIDANHQAIQDPNNLPTFYHPTTIPIVDDDVNFLSIIALKIKHNHTPQCFSSPENAFDEITSNFHSYNQLLNNAIKMLPQADSEGSVSESGTKQFTHILKWLKKKERFHSYSVAVIDYQMPEMGGDELCQKIADLPIKKIMLTGKAGLLTAVQLLNKRTIDQFILKKDLNTVNQLNHMIDVMSQEYFNDYPNKINSNNSIDRKVNQAFIETTNPIQSEYYLLDDKGSRLLLSYHGELTLFLVRSNDDFKQLLEIASASEASDDYMALLNGRKASPYFLTDEDECLEVQDWRKITYSCYQIDNSSYYYSVIKLPERYKTLTRDISSYDSHRYKV